VPVPVPEPEPPKPGHPVPEPGPPEPLRPVPEPPLPGPGPQPDPAPPWPSHGDPAGPGASQQALSDADLLKRHVAGDPDAFGILFMRHKDKLWAVALRTLADPEEAADALQDAMISAFRRAASFRGDAAVTTWLHRIVVNACLDRMRRRAARPAVSSGDDRLLDAAAAAGHVSDPAADSELAIDVSAALRELPHDQRVAIVLVDMLGYPVADAADVLGISQGTVKSRCARGRAKLLPKLAYLRAHDMPRVQAMPGSRAGAGSPPDVAGAGSNSPRPGRNRSAAGDVLSAQDGGEQAP
jgi:RNA polymerase sigma-70 factor, ECF subfamily